MGDRKQNLPKVNILLVDDREENLVALEAILSDLRQNLIKAHSGQEALRYILERDFAVIILDVNMPEMDGFETASFIKKREQSQHTPIIFLTAHSSDEACVFQGYSIGAVDYVTKPFVPEILKAKVKVFIELFYAHCEIAMQAQELRQINEQLRQSLDLAERSRQAMLSALEDRKKAEQNLQKIYQEIEQRVKTQAGEIVVQKQYLENILCSMADGVCVVNTNKQVILWNRAAEKITGWKAEAIVGKICDTILKHQNVHGNLLCSTDQCPYVIIHNGQKPVEHMELLAAHCSGHMIPLAISTAMLFDDKGKLIGRVEVFRDIAQELKLRESILQANQTKSVFLANMSHEIRTPLNAILGFTQIMLRNQTMNPQQMEQLQTIYRSGNHLLELINEILEISKIEAGRLTLNAVTFDLPGMIDELARMFQERIASKALRFIVERSDMLPRFVITDANKLRRILMNLLGNAVKFTRQGTIVLRVRVEQGHDAKLRLYAEVEDTGVGISPEEHEKLFRYFAQTDSGRQLQEGTGLGLAISREYVRLLSGEISVVSEVGKGSLFKFNIAIQAGNAAEVIESRTSRRQVVGLESGQAPIRILVVDDIEENRRMLVQMLTMIGFNIQEASNGQEAVAKFIQWHPQLILMDMRMPVMDGYEATRQIKALAQPTPVKIIALTASVFEEDRQDIFKAGVDGYLRKPFHDYEIFDIIGQQLGLRYLYIEMPVAAASQRITTAASVDSEMLSLLPAELRAQLYAAAITADIDRLLELIAPIATAYPQLAEMLKKLAEAYDYNTLSLLCHPATGLGGIK